MATLASIINKIGENPNISEVESNGPNSLFIKENGVRKEIESPFKTEEQYFSAIDELIEYSKLKNAEYLVEGRYRFPDGRSARLHITMPPASVYPQMTLAIKTDTLKDLAAIQGTGTFNTEISMFLKAAVNSKLTIVISGGTGAGKTTLLEALTNEFDHDERIGVCEGSPELNLSCPNTAYLNSTVWVPGLDMNDVAPLSWCVKQINRMRVDRVIIGETRGEEFFDFITAANSGAEGSLTTIHANDSPSAMKKMSTFMFMAADMNPRIINEMISSAVDVVIQLGRNKKDNKNKIMEISEVTQSISSGESPTIALNPLFTYDEDTDSWHKKYATDQLKARFELFGYDGNTYRKREDEDDYHDVGYGLPSYFGGGQ